MTKKPKFPKPGEIPEHHPESQRFPMLPPDQLHDMAGNIVQRGLMEAIVMLGGQILDGRNRHAACLLAGVKPRYELFDPKLHGTPAEFVVAKNVRRRHLTPSQRAAFALEVLPKFQAEAKERQRKAGKEHAAPLKKKEPKPHKEKAVKAKPAKADKPAKEKSAEGNFIPGTKIPSFSANPPKSGSAPSAAKPLRAMQQAAKVTGASERGVERAAEIQAEAPEKIEEVKLGTKTLAKAHRETREEKAAAARQTPEIVQAIGRIEAVCGKQTADPVREGLVLKSADEILAYTALPDDEMIRVRSLVLEGWGVEKSLKYEAKALSRTHPIGDLVKRAQASGGMFTLELDGWLINVTKKTEN